MIYLTRQDGHATSEEAGEEASNPANEGATYNMRKQQQ